MHITTINDLGFAKVVLERTNPNSLEENSLYISLVWLPPRCVRVAISCTEIAALLGNA